MIFSRVIIILFLFLHTVAVVGITVSNASSSATESILESYSQTFGVTASLSSSMATTDTHTWVKSETEGNGSPTISDELNTFSSSEKLSFSSTRTSTGSIVASLTDTLVGSVSTSLELSSSDSVTESSLVSLSPSNILLESSSISASRTYGPMSHSISPHRSVTQEESGYSLSATRSKDGSDSMSIDESVSRSEGPSMSQTAMRSGSNQISVTKGSLSESNTETLPDSASMSNFEGRDRPSMTFSLDMSPTSSPSDTVKPVYASPSESGRLGSSSKTIVSSNSAALSKTGTVEASTSLSVVTTETQQTSPSSTPYESVSASHVASVTTSFGSSNSEALSNTLTLVTSNSLSVEETETQRTSLSPTTHESFSTTFATSLSTSAENSPTLSIQKSRSASEVVSETNFVNNTASISISSTMSYQTTASESQLRTFSQSQNGLSASLSLPSSDSASLVGSLTMSILDTPTVLGSDSLSNTETYTESQSPLEASNSLSDVEDSRSVSIKKESNSATEPISDSLTKAITFSTSNTRSAGIHSSASESGLGSPSKTIVSSTSESLSRTGTAEASTTLSVVMTETQQTSPSSTPYESVSATHVASVTTSFGSSNSASLTKTETLEVSNSVTDPISDSLTKAISSSTTDTRSTSTHGSSSESVPWHSATSSAGRTDSKSKPFTDSPSSPLPSLSGSLSTSDSNSDINFSSSMTMVESLTGSSTHTTLSQTGPTDFFSQQSQSQSASISVASRSQSVPVSSTDPSSLSRSIPNTHSIPLVGSISHRITSTATLQLMENVGYREDSDEALDALFAQSYFAFAAFELQTLGIASRTRCAHNALKTHFGHLRIVAPLAIWKDDYVGAALGTAAVLSAVGLLFIIAATTAMPGTQDMPALARLYGSSRRLIVGFARVFSGLWLQLFLAILPGFLFSATQLTVHYTGLKALVGILCLGFFGAWSLLAPLFSLALVTREVHVLPTAEAGFVRRWFLPNVAIRPNAARRMFWPVCAWRFPWAALSALPFVAPTAVGVASGILSFTGPCSWVAAGLGWIFLVLFLGVCFVRPYRSHIENVLSAIIFLLCVGEMALIAYLERDDLYEDEIIFALTIVGLVHALVTLVGRIIIPIWHMLGDSWWWNLDTITFNVPTKQLTHANDAVFPDICGWLKSDVPEDRQAAYASTATTAASVATQPLPVNQRDQTIEDDDGLFFSKAPNDSLGSYKAFDRSSMSSSRQSQRHHYQPDMVVDFTDAFEASTYVQDYDEWGADYGFLGEYEPNPLFLAEVPMPPPLEDSRSSTFSSSSSSDEEEASTEMSRHRKSSPKIKRRNPQNNGWMSDANY